MIDVSKRSISSCSTRTSCAQGKLTLNLVWLCVTSHQKKNSLSKMAAFIWNMWKERPRLWIKKFDGTFTCDKCHVINLATRFITTLFSLTLSLQWTALFPSLYVSFYQPLCLSSSLSCLVSLLIIETNHLLASSSRSSHSQYWLRSSCIRLCLPGRYADVFLFKRNLFSDSSLFISFMCQMLRKTQCTRILRIVQQDFLVAQVVELDRHTEEMANLLQRKVAEEAKVYLQHVSVL